jgi:phage/plasmid primase-like uncharacterized protein
VTTSDPVISNPLGKVINPSKYDAVCAVTALLAQLLVPISVPVNDPLKLPVLICADDDTVPEGNIVGANEADVANDAVVGINVILVAADAVVANDAVTGVNVIDVAADADTELLAQLDVPNSEPVKELADTLP